MRNILTGKAAISQDAAADFRHKISANMWGTGIKLQHAPDPEVLITGQNVVAEALLSSLMA
jgi:hypothetical protein